ADQAAQRNAGRQLGPLLALERLDLARRELDAAGDFVERPALGHAQRVQRLADGRRRRGRFGSGDCRIEVLRHACTCAMGMVRAALRWATRVRSRTSPASWPHAASMSSPRVLRTVVTIPASIRRWAKTLTR